MSYLEGRVISANRDGNGDIIVVVRCRIIIGISAISTDGVLIIRLVSSVEDQVVAVVLLIFGWCVGQIVIVGCVFVEFSERIFDFTTMAVNLGKFGGHFLTTSNCIHA